MVIELQLHLPVVVPTVQSHAWVTIPSSSKTEGENLAEIPGNKSCLSTWIRKLSNCFPGLLNWAGEVSNVPAPYLSVGSDTDLSVNESEGGNNGIGESLIGQIRVLAMCSERYHLCNTCHRAYV